MVEQRQSFLHEVDRCAGVICDVLRQPPSFEQLVLAHKSIEELTRVVAQAETDSFRQICAPLEKLFARFIECGTTPSAIEVEVIELAIDWLRQLAFLYSEAIPEPRALVNQLVYTFELVEHSHGAASLTDLNFEKNAPDLFNDDPEMDVDGYHPSEEGDLFNGDPGFGLEFDLLQRTLNHAPIKSPLEIDPFSDDGGVSEDDVSFDSQPPPDLFGEDPSALD